MLNIIKKCFVPVILVISCCNLLCGCASITNYTKFYNGAEKPLSLVAIVTEPNPYLKDLIVLRVDEREAQMAGVLELLPGKHKIQVLYYAKSANYKTTGTATAEIDLKAGRIYEIFPVFHTHNNDWLVGSFDVTDELIRPEKRELAQKLDEIIKANRGNTPSVVTLSKSLPVNNEIKLPGFGEKIISSIQGEKGTQIKIEYDFDRYKPFRLIKGSDGREYHIQISQENGVVEKVLGLKVDVGDPKQIYPAFQPFKSDTALVYSPQDGTIINEYKEMPDGSYKLIK
ncbi:MAG: hypothetical protein C0403_12455 [Desulfobacterium sp.]|nr:hypothetical protein [Desulfobacterium sp.]